MADKRTGTGEERTPTTRGVALLEKLGVPRRIEVVPPPAEQPPFPSTPQEGGEPGLPLSLQRPVKGPLGMERGGAAAPEAFPPPASYPEACSAARARPARPAFAAAAPPPPKLPEPTEPREPGGAPAATASSSLWFSSSSPPPTPHFLIRDPSQPCGLTQVPPPHAARAILGAALPASSLGYGPALAAFCPAPAPRILKGESTFASAPIKP
ncbi:basic proline-rich protein-like [Mustela lutreola]|uniref:basic proline-rich protein-like n=1 Tax=Mustela lutreola TaxID=9666 RepID=UPI0027979ABB|nr:basic proline-rich protein-like [Mustela lutreola]